MAGQIIFTVAGESTLKNNNNAANAETNNKAKSQTVSTTLTIGCPAQVIAGGPQMPVLVPIPFENLPEGSKDRLLHATARIGIPLYYHVFPYFGLLMSPSECFALEGQVAAGNVLNTSDNRVLHHLSTKTSSTSPNICHVTVPGTQAPDIVLTRADGKDLEEDLVRAIFLFMEVELPGTLAPGVPDIPLHQRLTPEAFIKFWNMLNEVEKVDCAVKMACGKCGRAEGKMMKCGKCGVVRYCGRECQSGDWKYHQKVCVK